MNFSAKMIRGWIAPALCVVLFASLSPAGKTFVKPEAKSAISYPAHDAHSDEKVTVAADPYDTPEKRKIFSIDFSAHGFLPIFFIVTNDGGKPVSIANMQIVMITGGDRAKLTPVAVDDVYRRISNPQSNARPSTIPIPLPHKEKASQKAVDEVAASQFEARAVEPHTTQSGFLFFDVGGISSPLRGSSIEITGIDDATGNELMYFEIPMDKYLNASANP
jgi:hypothetical protein